MGHLRWKYYIVYTVWDLLETIFIYLYVVETKGRTLEETALLFDDPQEADTLAARANVHGGHLAQGEKNGSISGDNSSDEKIHGNEEHLQHVERL